MSMDKATADRIESDIVEACSILKLLHDGEDMADFRKCAGRLARSIFKDTRLIFPALTHPPVVTAPKPKVEGDKCRMPECDGRYGYRSLSNCYCHISSPCYECVENPLVCLDCGDDLPDAEIPESQGGATT